MLINNQFIYDLKLIDSLTRTIGKTEKIWSYITGYCKFDDSKILPLGKTKRKLKGYKIAPLYIQYIYTETIHSDL